MRFLFFVICVCMFPALGRADLIRTFDDIDFWVGSGVNQAAIVIDWDGTRTTDRSLAWGFRWNGNATGEDMFFAVVQADSRLFAKVNQRPPTAGFGAFVRGIGYDTNGNGVFGITSASNFDSNGLSTEEDAGGLATDIGDDYREGPFFPDGWWNYGVSSNNPFNGGSWTSSNIGMKDRILSNGVWDSWAFQPGAVWPSSAFAANAFSAVPEPSSLALLGIAGVGAAWWRRRKSKKAKQNPSTK